MKRIMIIGFLLMTLQGIGQEKPGSALYASMARLDSLLFDVAFNTCNYVQLAQLTSDNFEFYHDQGGITLGKENFVNSVKVGVCSNNYKAIRKLVSGSMEVYPMHKDGKLYGAIQMGAHEFWALEPGKPIYQTSKAKFIHLWMLQNGEWKFYRGLSFDHIPTPR
jgi:hypothetical protein